MTTEAITCHRCGRRLDPERADLDGWLVLDARDDGWTLVVCPACQTRAERERVEALARAGRDGRGDTAALPLSREAVAQTPACITPALSRGAGRIRCLSRLPDWFVKSVEERYA